MTGYNIRNILQAAGYEVTNILIHVLDIRFTPEEIERKLAEIEQTGGSYDIDLYGTYTVILSEVGFNGEGGLYVVLETLDGECFDVIEFEGS